MDGTRICQDLIALVEAGTDLDELKKTAVKKVHESEERFHWTGIYDLFPDQTLRLGPFIGSPTNHVFIGVGQGVCGTAVAEKRNMNIPDVTQTDNYLACSAATRSELVVLIRIDGVIHGQIDIDSHDVDAFAGHVEGEVQKVADFLAPYYARQAGTRAA